MRRLDVNNRDFLRQTDKLSNLLDKVSDLEFEQQTLIAELVMVKLFSLLEIHFQSITLKVLCNTQYLDSTYPVLLLASANISIATSNILRYGRATPWRMFNIKWTKSQFIENNVQFLIDPSDNLISIFRRYDSVIDEMRRVRNHIAHNTQDTRDKYKQVVINHYGAFVNTITPGKLLLSTRRNPCLLKQYIITARIIIKELVKA